MGKSKTSNSYFLYVGAAVIVIGLIIFAANKESAPSIYDEFAQCLTEQGTVMYGAWWCSHCTNQKDAFGSSFDYIDSVECSAAGSKAMNSTCQDAGIEGYPTWEFADGSRVSGEQSFEYLASQTGCELPNEIN